MNTTEWMSNVIKKATTGWQLANTILPPLVIWRLQWNRRRKTVICFFHRKELKLTKRLKHTSMNFIFDIIFRIPRGIGKCSWTTDREPEQKTTLFRIVFVCFYYDLKAISFLFHRLHLAIMISSPSSSVFHIVTLLHTWSFFGTNKKCSQ